MIGHPRNIQDAGLTMDQLITASNMWDVNKLSQFLPTSIVDKSVPF